MKRIVPSLFGLLLVLALVLLRAADPYPVEVARETAFDFYQRLAPREKPNDFPIRVVDIDEASLADVGQWPWPRDRLALLTSRLAELGAAAVAFDVLFPEPDRMSPSRLAAGVPGLDPKTLPDTDALFAAAIAGAPVVMGFSDTAGTTALPPAPKAGIAISGTNPIGAVPKLRGAVLPLPAFADAASGLGSLSLDTGELATTVRRLPLLWTDGRQFFPTLSVEALRVALGAQNLVVLGETGAPYVEAVRVGEFTVPTMPGGELWLYYREPDPNLYVSARDILGDGYAALADRIAGHIVFVGTSASGLLDIHGTTLGDNVPGVSIHAEALEQILSNTYLTRTDWVSGLEIVGFLLTGVLLVLIVLRLGPLAGLLTGAIALGGFTAFSWFAYRQWGLMIDPSFPLFGLLITYAALTFFQYFIADADKRQIRRAFGYYVAPSLLTEIERNAGRLKLGGETRDLTVMFSDIRGFTALSERLPPESIVTLLNILFSALGKRIVTEMGTIDKFIGDSIMAFWNAPVDVPEHARRACLAALGMRAELRDLNARDGFGLGDGGTDRQAIAIGIGIATGPALVGNMGLETRFDYSCIGDTVNTASRVEGACKTVAYDIVVTAETRAAAPDFASLGAGAIALKGKALPVDIHILVGDAAVAKSAGFIALETEHRLALVELREGRDASGSIARCAAMCEAVEPGLAAFYETLTTRPEDFSARATGLSAQDLHPTGVIPAKAGIQP
ncbi:MAG TPA: adenylate/guanylate cyclase domain-containing protein [Devosia sp.]|nr:adenylate/guanylate cyclase domain-containing protein [Devosia sp.]